MQPLDLSHAHELVGRRIIKIFNLRDDCGYRPGIWIFDVIALNGSRGNTEVVFPAEGTIVGGNSRMEVAEFRKKFIWPRSLPRFPFFVPLKKAHQKKPFAAWVEGEHVYVCEGGDTSIAREGAIAFREAHVLHLNSAVE